MHPNVSAHQLFFQRAWASRPICVSPDKLLRAFNALPGSSSALRYRRALPPIPVSTSLPRPLSSPAFHSIPCTPLGGVVQTRSYTRFPFSCFSVRRPAYEACNSAFFSRFNIPILARSHSHQTCIAPGCHFPLSNSSISPSQDYPQVLFDPHSNSFFARLFLLRFIQPYRPSQLKVSRAGLDTLSSNLRSGTPSTGDHQ